MSPLTKVVIHQKYLLTTIFSIYLVGYFGVLISILFKAIYENSYSYPMLREVFFYVLVCCQITLIIAFIAQLFVSFPKDYLALKKFTHNKILFLVFLYVVAMVDLENITFFGYDILLNYLVFGITLIWLLRYSLQTRRKRSFTLIENIQYFSLVSHACFVMFLPSLSLAYFVLLYYPFILTHD